MTTQRRAGLLLSALALVAVSAVLLVRDAVALQPVLAQVQVDLEAARVAVEDGDRSTAEAALDQATAGAAAAEARADGPLWGAAGLVPRYGASARAVTDGVDLAAATVQLATAGLTEALTLIDQGASAFVGPGGRIQTATLTEAADALEALPLAPLREARDELAALPASGLLGPTRDARDDAVARATAVINQVERASIGARTFAGFLGADAPRTYLLAVQNPAELRGTGGLLSVLTELTVTDGVIDVRPAGGGDLVADRITSGGQQTVGFDLTPVDRPSDFAARYDNNGGGAIIQSVNLDPDLPTVAPVLLELYRERTGATADGVVIVDPFALAQLLGATGGPLAVSPDVLAAAPGLPDALTVENTPQTLLIDVYDAFGGTNPARDTFNEGVTLSVLERLESGDWEPAPVARALGDAAASRRLQLFSTDADEQAGLEALGLAGQMTSTDEVGDLLAVTGVNAGPDKSDAHVGHRITADITLAARPGAVPWQVIRETDVTVEVTNPLRPDDHDDYITGTNEPSPVGQGSPRVRDALNRTWFTIWSPATTELAALRDGVSGDVLRTGRIHDHRAIDYFLETPSASTASFQAPFRGPLELQQVGGLYVYELELWRQAKAIPDVWDLSLTAPMGLSIDSVDVTGGGPPATGLGPLETGPLEVAFDDGSLRLTGSVTRDVTVRVYLRG